MVGGANIINDKGPRISNGIIASEKVVTSVDVTDYVDISA